MKHAKKKFEKAGLPVRIIPREEIPGRVRRQLEEGVFFADVHTDKSGEHFRICPGNSRIQVLNVSKDSPHILVHVDTDPDPYSPRGDKMQPVGSKRKMIFGHDERHLFVAELSAQNVSTVKQALDSLRPGGAGTTDKRQGEWFFKPMPDLDAKKNMIQRNATIPGVPGAANPHVAEELYVDRETRWPVHYVRGKIKHSDHATLKLDVWHLVIPNAERRDQTLHNFVD